MFTITKENFEQDMESYMRVHGAVEQLAESYVSNFGEGGREYVDEFEIEYDGVFGTILLSTEVSTHCGCCGPDYNSYTIPLAYLFDKDWIETEKNSRSAKALWEKEQRAAKAVIRKREKAVQDAEKKKKLEAERYADFLKMKEEYKDK